LDDAIGIIRIRGSDLKSRAMSREYDSAKSWLRIGEDPLDSAIESV
jgi:hypothetical protein